MREYSPERHPERFAAIRQAYESLRDLDTRLDYRLFKAGQNETVDALIEEVSCRGSRRRVSLETLLSVIKQP